MKKSCAVVIWFLGIYVWEGYRLPGGGVKWCNDYYHWTQEYCHQRNLEPIFPNCAPGLSVAYRACLTSNRVRPIAPEERQKDRDPSLTPYFRVPAEPPTEAPLSCRGPKDYWVLGRCMTMP